jgi:valyl-tRNA synthetase
MDPDMSASVIHSFVDLYNKGLIYRGYRMVNWDQKLKRLYQMRKLFMKNNKKLYFLKYKIEEVKTSILLRRPEIFGDSAICVNQMMNVYRR